MFGLIDYLSNSENYPTLMILLMVITLLGIAVLFVALHKWGLALVSGGLLAGHIYLVMSLTGSDIPLQWLFGLAGALMISVGLLLLLLQRISPHERSQPADQTKTRTREEPTDAPMSEIIPS